MKLMDAVGSAWKDHPTDEVVVSVISKLLLPYIALNLFAIQESEQNFEFLKQL